MIRHLMLLPAEYQVDGPGKGKGATPDCFWKQSGMAPFHWPPFHWPVGRYWRAALVVFFNYGVDTGTVWLTSRDVARVDR